MQKGLIQLRFHGPLTWEGTSLPKLSTNGTGPEGDGLILETTFLFAGGDSFPVSGECNVGSGFTGYEGGFRLLLSFSITNCFVSARFVVTTFGGIASFPDLVLLLISAGTLSLVLSGVAESRIFDQAGDADLSWLLLRDFFGGGGSNGVTRLRSSLGANVSGLLLAPSSSRWEAKCALSRDSIS